MADPVGGPPRAFADTASLLDRLVGPGRTRMGAGGRSAGRHAAGRPPGASRLAACCGRSTACPAHSACASRRAREDSAIGSRPMSLVRRAAAAPGSCLMSGWYGRSSTSPGPSRSSCSFSPGRRPVNTMSTGRPALAASRRATSAIRTGSPMSSTRTSPSRADRGRLEDELHGLLAGHEVAGDLGMGHRDRAARGDLRGQGGEHRAAAAEHVAEADGQVACRRPGRPCAR